ncbi:MAG: Crp/Fnr family transcriptional regulator [Actinobacteria bacterium]|nr:Crp/Fnr family transcriptional regulator [Actinomycetota bacterium]
MALDDVLNGRDPRRNGILAGISKDEYAGIEPSLDVFDAELRQPVYAPERPIEHVYFPLGAVFSVVAVTAGEMVVEVGTVGIEGMVGLPAFLGVAVTPNSAFCQIAGPAVRMPVEDLHRALRNGAGLHDHLLRYTQAFIVQVAQNVLCNRTHTTEERAARWLLMTADRVEATEFLLTHEFLAQMLGVRRPTVSLSAGLLQSAGLISYTRGRVRILDRERLEEASCECYRVVRAEFDRLHQAQGSETTGSS